ncbi:MAG: glycosyltransferase [Leptospirales bacterium]
MEHLFPVARLLDEPLAGKDGERQNLEEGKIAPVRVLYFIDNLRAGGGSQRYIYELVRIARKIGIAPHICTLEEGGDYYTEILHSGVPTFSLSLPRINSPRAIGKLVTLVRWIRHQRIQVIHTFQTNPNVFGTLAGRLAGIKVITSRRDLGNFGMRGSKSLTIFEEKVINPLAHRIMANSKAVFDATHRQEGISTEKMVLIRNGIDAGRFRPDPDRKWRTSLGIPENALVFGTVSGLRKIKAVDLLLQAFRSVRERVPEAFLIVAGDGPEASDLHTMAQRLKIMDSLKFLGRRLDVETILPAFDVFVMSSLSEGFPNAVLEAMACGVPVIATSVGGIRELVIPEETGRLVPPNNIKELVEAMVRIAENPSVRAEFSLNARQYVEKHFQFETIAHQLKEMYREVL